ncbi:pectin methylesterase, family CE8 [Zostera marina]|uniref:Pectinesterase n=1 Tax=Zostera marina TaxID=29655 RepID=A0A0K9NVI2_ZOSMR|nr:pectin methylesterase, family CE8 [Zostera marina]
MKSAKLTILAATVAFLLLLGVIVVCAIQYKSGESEDKKKDNEEASEIRLHAQSKQVKEMCSVTEYDHVCVVSLSNILKQTNLSNPQTKDLMRGAVIVVSDEISKVWMKSKLIKSDDPNVKGAVQDCEGLFRHAKKELLSSIQAMNIQGIEELPKKSPEIKNWLSAVLSYQQTCVDGFPDGTIKNKMQNIVKLSKELTCNALAIIDKVSSILEDLNLSDVVNSPTQRTTTGRVLPEWLDGDDRRFLMGRHTKKMKPNITVAQDGSGNFTTIVDAIAAIPYEHEGRICVYIKRGIYTESPILMAPNVTFYGDGSRKTIITGSKNFVDGVRTFHTATFAVDGDGFMAIGIGFRNTAGAVKLQAVALRVQSDRAIFLNCHMDGYQDTLYAQTHRQFYRGCVISGTIDFIFGDASAVFQNSVLRIRKPLENQQNIVTAHGRMDNHESTGFVIQNCKFVAVKGVEIDPKKISYLGRPWRECSRTIIMESDIGDFVNPDGYLPWDGSFGLKTLFYGEYNNSGAGAKLNQRVRWPGFKVITKEEAERFTAGEFIQGRDWIQQSGVPARFGLYHD